MSGGREVVAVVATATVAAVALTFPFATQMTYVGRIDNFDGAFGIWNVAWVARTLIVDPAHVLDANIFFPHKGTLVYSETNLGAGALAIPAYWATRNPYFAFNFMFLLSMVLSATGTYYLVRHLVEDRRAAAVSGLAFGFCAYVFGHTPQMQLLMTAGLPFSLLAFHRLADRPTLGRATVLGLVMAGQVALCGYYAVFVMLMIPFAALVVAATRIWWTNLPYWRALAVAAVVAVVAALPVLVPYAQLQRTTGFERALDEASRYSADWRAYFASAALAHRWMLPLLGRWNEVLFPGFIALVGGGTGLVFGLVNRRMRETAILYGLLGAIMCWASFGPNAGLYTVFYQTIPPFTLMRAPARFGIVVTLALSVLAGIAVRELLARVSRPTVVGIALALATAAELAFPLRFRQIPPVPAAYTMLATLPAGPVIELPFFSSGRELFGHARYMLNSTSHWMPLINGYSDYIPPDFREGAPVLRMFPSAESFKLLAAHRPRYAVFHMGLFGDDDRAATAARISEFARFLTPLYTEGDVHLYEIVGFQ
ncbi:MAG TPA: hypothetical protein VM818_07195 [Vicinamibacterales bacterium]|nr:hypothetical protein [Vicinamibacterales bacterium]